MIRRIVAITLMSLNVVAWGQQSGSSNTEATYTAMAQQPGTSPMLNKIKGSGDFRYRYQTELDDKDDERTINKLRVRLGAAIELAEETSLNFRLASYTKPETSQTSGNFNMGDSSGYGFQRRMIGIDQAYVDYHPFTQFKIQLGKVPMNLVFAGKSQMILDSDLSPEGFASYSKWSINDSWETYFNFGYFVIAENYGTGTPKVEETDNVIYAPQLGLKYKLDYWQFQAMVSKVVYSALKGDPFNHTCCASTATAKARGNSEGTVAGTYLYDYDINDFGFEAKTKIDAYELNLFIQSFINSAVKNKNRGGWAGFSLANGPFSMMYAQGQAEADAVVAAFTDADLAKGETDSLGQQLTLQYKVTPYWLLALNQYNSEYKRSSAPAKYKRMSVDMQWSF